MPRILENWGVIACNKDKKEKNYEKDFTKNL
jgi:hypothetical protein